MIGTQTPPGSSVHPLRRSRAAVASMAVACLAAVSLPLVAATTAHADPRATEKNPVAVGTGGAVTSVDPEATRIGVEVLRDGGTAADAAVATAAALGVTEPYSAGLGGGGFFVHYDAETGEVTTIDGRETAPMGIEADAFINPETGEPYNFFPERVTSGVSVGVPGTPATWATALEEYGSWSLREVLKPAAKLARRGFVVDETFREQTAQNAERFSAIEPTAELFLPGGEPPVVGSIFRNRDLARTYKMLGKRGMDAFYEGALAAEIAEAVQNPPTAPDTDLPVPPGSMTTADLADYEVRTPAPTLHDYRGFEVYGMAPPSSGGSTVGEILNIVEQEPVGETTALLHRYLEASALAYADRGKYLGDSEFVDVPLQELLSDGFAAERACEIGPMAADKPVLPGDADGSYDTDCDGTDDTGGQQEVDTEGLSTTHLTVVDQWGDVVAYTLTIEQTGGSGITVPDRGFLLNNELTDFTAFCEDPDEGANCIEPGKRPRSSISPTIVLDDGEPWLALGSPGGSTIITTVAQTLLNRIDRDMTLPQAIAEPRASQRNTKSVTAEPRFVDTYGTALAARGHTFSETDEIGAATAIEILPDGRVLAAAEPVRRGGGDARVVEPAGGR